MKIGLLGTGFGSYHAQLYKEISPENELVVFGRNWDKLQGLKKDLGCSVTTEMEDILADPEIELVDICLPSHLHKEIAIRAMEKGKHVFIETPFVLTVEDGEALIATSQKTGMKVYVNMFIRFQSPYQHLYELKNSGRYGALKYLEIYRKTPGIWGALGLETIPTALMIHEFDFVTWLLGAPEKLVYEGIENEEGNKAHIDANLKYEETLVHIASNSMMPMGYPFTVGYEAVFQEATLQYHEQFYDDREASMLKLYANQQDNDITFTKENCYKAAIAHVLQHIASKEVTASPLSLEEAMHSIRCALQIIPPAKKAL